jgi:hypothetical protein
MDSKIPGGTQAMSESERSHRNEETIPESRTAYWKTVHHTWWFWFGLVLMLAAMSVYILSDNLSFLPHG